MSSDLIEIENQDLVHAFFCAVRALNWYENSGKCDSRKAMGEILIKLAQQVEFEFSMTAADELKAK